MAKSLNRWERFLVEYLPLPLAFVIATFVYLCGVLIGTIASDLWGYILTYRREHGRPGNIR